MFQYKQANIHASRAGFYKKLISIKFSVSFLFCFVIFFLYFFFFFCFFFFFFFLFFFFVVVVFFFFFFFFFCFSYNMHITVLLSNALTAYQQDLNHSLTNNTVYILMNLSLLNSAAYEAAQMATMLYQPPRSAALDMGLFFLPMSFLGDAGDKLVGERRSVVYELTSKRI